MISIKIDLDKIDDSHIFEGKKGRYLDVILFDREDEYGNDGFAVQGVSKEAREAGERGEILGNWRNLETKQRQGKAKFRKALKPATRPAPEPEDAPEGDDNSPF